MTALHWFAGSAGALRRALIRNLRHPAPRRPCGLRLALEWLEDRRVPALVTSKSDDAADTGSLRYALEHAAAGETVSFAVGGTIQLSATLNLTKNVTIEGGAGITLNGADQ